MLNATRHRRSLTRKATVLFNGSPVSLGGWRSEIRSIQMHGFGSHKRRLLFCYAATDVLPLWLTQARS